MLGIVLACVDMRPLFENIIGKAMITLKWKHALGGLAAAAALVACAPRDVKVETGAFAPDWESLKQWECPEWFKDAKFGIWAHWGPQCQAEGGDWYARHMYYERHWQYRWHKEHFGDPADYGLKELIRDWTAPNWQPDSLVALYKSVGARYFFTLGQHHDNFDLWDSPYQEWNSVNLGPKRDIVGEWAAACEKYGLPIGISMHGSHTWTWMEKSQDYDGNLTKADGKGQWWEGFDPQELYAQRHEHSEGWEREGSIHGQWGWKNGASLPSEEYKMKFQNRVLQCINDYDPDILYFDDTVLPFYGCDDQIGLNILSHYYNRSARLNGGQQQVVAMGKVLEEEHKELMMWDVERGAPDRAQEKYWQTCTCIGSWHYEQGVYNNNRYKSAEQVISMLVDIVSKNGNLLLSIPIRADGTIDDKEMAVLAGIKAWMDVNSNSIYGTRPWKIFGEGPSAEASRPINAQGFNENNNYTSADVRFVQRNDTVFTTIMRWPEEREYTIKSLGSASAHYNGEVKGVQLLGYGAVPFVNSAEGLVVTLPAENTNEIAPVLEVTF
jgi:alpha-L-fucosidase